MPKIVNRDDSTAEMIKSLSGLGITHEQICAIVKISKPTLYKYYQEELQEGKANANAQVAKNLFKIATGSGREAVTASIFWLKTQAKWKETDVIEVNNVAEQDEQFRKLISNIREAKLSEKDSNESTH
jgi:virulence-associated protein VapD|tara:strand:- start:1120 stop:1503 length:384 start_codon:yes stop_codon:yes gene_type:complete